MTPYHRILDEAIEGRDVSVVAREWGVPVWVLFDGLREKATAPSTPYVASVARGCGLSSDELLDKLGIGPRNPISPPQEAQQRPVVAPSPGGTA